jgi:hypothetical protein
MQQLLRYFSCLVLAVVVTSLSAAEPRKSAYSVAGDVRSRAIRLGIVLPLHDRNGDGKRMVEYYRGVLMACDSLKKEGISIDVHAWNAPENSDLTDILASSEAASRDLFIGPLYSKQVEQLAAFTRQHGSLMVIPFSINAPQLRTQQNIFQIYQYQDEQNESTIRRFCDLFADCHPVIVDCADSASTKGSFTSGLRKELEKRNRAYNLTSLRSKDKDFCNAFSESQKNVVVLNSGSKVALNTAIGKLSTLSLTKPSLKICMFGYSDWLPLASRQLENFYKYEVYIPTTFYSNQLSPATDHLNHLYRANFHQEMMATYPRFALTGFDHAYFFLKGLHKYGMAFDGAAGRFGYPPVQTPLKFVRVGDGGYQNKAFIFVHYRPEQRIELLNY